MRRISFRPRILVVASAAVGGGLAAIILSLPATAQEPRRSAAILQPSGTHTVTLTPPGEFASSIAGFTRSTTVAPQAAASELGTLAGGGNGLVIQSDARTLSVARDQRPAFYAAPTDKGALCYWIAGGPDGCFDGFTQAFPVSWNVYDPDGTGRGTPTTVAGIAPNDVTTIGVRIGTETYAASLIDNTFFFRAPGAKDTPTSLDVAYSDGTSLVVPLPTLP